MLFIQKVFLIVLISINWAYSENTSKFYENAIKSHSDSLKFVLITIKNVKNDHNRRYCLAASSLIRAIQYEYGIKKNIQGRLEAENIILENSERVYSFKKKKALKTIKPEYDEKTFNVMNSIFGVLDDNDLKNIFRLNSDDVKYHNAYSSGKHRVANLFAVAHILIERGFWVEFNYDRFQLYIVE